MSTEPATEEQQTNAFVRIDPAVRDRLRKHCQEAGLVMGHYVSRIITNALDSTLESPPAPKRRPAARRRPAAAKRIKRATRPKK